MLKYANFTLNWKVDCSKYDEIGNTPGYQHKKHFITACNNVVFKWYACLEQYNPTETEFSICYTDGPLDTIDRVEYKIDIVKRDGSVRKIREADYYDVDRDEDHWIALLNKSSVAIRSEYGLQETDPLVFQITLKLRMKMFAYAPPVGIWTPADHPVLSRNAKGFNSIQNPNDAKFSDATLISREGVEFYCHKIVVGQTEPLETMFSDPLAGLEQSSKSPKKRRRGTKRNLEDSESNEEAPTIGNSSTVAKKKGVYEFNEMATSSLKAMIEYLYTGQSTLTSLTITEIFELADAAEQYFLKPLKESCVAHLWKYVAKRPESAFEIVRFADLHEDWKYLKDRALDVIVENYQYLDIEPKSLRKRFGGTRRKELKNELIDYMAKRRGPHISESKDDDDSMLELDLDSDDD